MTVGVPVILHVDDDPLSLKTLKRKLRKYPFELISVQNGYEAILTASKTPVDLAILDVAMPVMDGFNVLAGLRRENPNLPAIMLTGMNVDSVLYQAVNEGCDGYIEKPYDADWLMQKIQFILANHSEKRLTQASKRNQRHLIALTENFAPQSQEKL